MYYRGRNREGKSVVRKDEKMRIRTIVDGVSKQEMYDEV